VRIRIIDAWSKVWELPIKTAGYAIIVTRLAHLVRVGVALLSSVVAS